MKIKKVAAALFLLGFPAVSLQASSLAIPIVFDNISGVDNNLVWVQFMGGTNVAGGTYRDNQGSLQSIQANTAYSLASMISGTTPLVAGQDGKPIMTLEGIISGRVYISYGLEGLQGMGNPGGAYTPAVENPLDPNYLTRFQYWELTVQNGVLTADLSYIDFTAISFSMNAVGQAAAISNGTQNSLPTQSLVNVLTPVALKNGENVIPGASFVLPNQQFSRVIGPGYEIVVPGNPPQPNPTPQPVYPDFTDYLNHLQAKGTTATIAGIYGGQGGAEGPEFQKQTYNFTATFANNQVTLAAVTTAAVASGDGEASPIPIGDRGNGVGSNNSIVISFADLNATTGIYGANPTYTVTNNGIATVEQGIKNDFFGWVMGDLLSGLALGLIGSTQSITIAHDTTTINDLPSSAWWGGGVDSSTVIQYVPNSSGTAWIPVNNTTTPAAQSLIYRFAQPANPFYNVYADALSGATPSVPLTDGYAFPFGDRLGQNLLSINVGVDPNAYLTFTINTDNGTSIPTFIWDSGGGSGNWDDKDNWNPGTVPTSGAVVEFGSGNQNTITLGADRTIDSLIFTSGANPFTFAAGNNLILAANPAATSPYTGYIVNLTTQTNTTHTFNNTVEFQTNGTIATVNGNLAFQDVVLGSNSLTLASAGHSGHTTTIAGTLTGSGDLRLTGLGTLILEGANAGFTGNVLLHGGILQLDQADSAGTTGFFELSAGTIRAGSSPLTFTNELRFGSANFVGANAGVIFGGTQAMTFSGPATLYGSATLNTAANVNLSGLLSATGPNAAAYTLTKTGAGTLTLSGSDANTFAGAYAVNDGILAFNKGTGPAFFNTLTIGDGTGAASSAQVQILAANQAPVGANGGLAAVTINSDGELNVTTFSLPVFSLDLFGGSVQATTGSLAFTSFAGTVNDPSPFINFQGTGNSTSTIAALLDVNNGTTSGALGLNVQANSASSAQLTLSGGLAGNGTIGKSGGGTASIPVSASTSGFTGLLNVAGGKMEIGSLTGATLNPVGGLVGVGGENQIEAITIANISLGGGGFLFDLGDPLPPPAASDHITVTGNINTITGKQTTFVFNDAGFTSAAAGTNFTFTLMSGVNVTATNISSVNFASQNIAGLSGSLQFNVVDSINVLQFVGSHGNSNTWSTTAASGDWSTQTNWVGGLVPAPGADLLFGATTSATIDTQANRSTGNITFEAAAPAYTINNNILTLGGNLTNNSTNTQTINSNIVLDYSRTISAASGNIQIGGSPGVGNLALSNGVFANDLLLAASTGTTITINSNITNISLPFQPGQAKGSVIIDGPGTVVLTGTNTFSGTMTAMGGGTVSVSSVNALGSSNPDEAVTMVFDGSTLLATGNLSFSDVQDTALFNPIQIGDSGFSMDASSAAQAITINVPLIAQNGSQGIGGFTKKGDNTLTLGLNTALSTFGGVFSVESGTVLASLSGSFGNSKEISITGTGSLQTGSNMTLAQSMTLGSTGNTNSEAGLLLTVGNINLTGAMTLTADSSIQIGANNQVAGAFLYGPINLQSNTLTLFTNGAANLTFGTIFGNISGSGGLTKTGNSNLLMQSSSTNTYSGPTSVQAGVLVVSVNENLTGTSGEIEILSGASLQFNFIQSSPNQAPIQFSNKLTLAGAGVGASAPGALNNLLGTTLISSSDIELTGNTTFAVSNGLLNFNNPSATFKLNANTLTLGLLPGTQGSILGSVTGTGNIVMQQSGQFMLSGDNTFSGGVTIHGGLFIASAANALGTGAVTVASGSTLGLSSAAGNVSFASGSISLNGTGINNNGALRSLSGNNTVTSAVTVATAGTTIQVDSGSLTLNNLTLPAGATILNAVDKTSLLTVNSLGSASGLSITVNAQTNPTQGTVIFGGTNTNTGSTVTAMGGTVQTSASNALQTLNLVLQPGSTFISGGLDTILTSNMNSLSPGANTTFIFGLTSPVSSDRINLNTGVNFGGLNTITFQLEEVGTFAGAGTYTLVSGTGAPVGFDSINLAPVGPLTSYSFQLEQSGNDLNLVVSGSGPASAIWDGGGTDGNWTTALNWVGDQVPAAGSAVTFGGSSQTTVSTVSNQSTGSMTFAPGASAFIINDNTLSIAGDITNSSANLQTINSTVEFTSSRSILANTGDLAFGAIAINSSAPTARTITFGGSENITVSGIISDIPTAQGNLLMSGTGILTLGGTNTFAGTVTLNSGTTAVSSSANLGNASATNDLVFNGGTLQALASFTSASTRSIHLESTGLLNLNSFNVGINGVISGSSGLTTSGSGTLTLGGVNTFTGATTIGTGGVLALGANNVLGSTAQVVIDSGAALSLQGGQSISATPLQLSGTGISGNGALRSVSGTNSYSGPITLAANSTVRADAGSLALPGAITNAGFGITFAPQAGAAITASGGINGTGGLTLSGAPTGTVTLTGSGNTYSGATQITSGILATGSLPNSAVTLNGGDFSPGGVGTIASITVQALTLDGGDLLFDLGASASDLITVTGGTATLSSPTVFNFHSINYTPGTFDLITGAGVAGFNLADLSYQSIIPNFSGQFQIAGSTLQFVSGSGGDKTWGAAPADGEWGTSGNWTPSGVPASGESITFSASSQTAIDVGAPRTTGTITFVPNADAFTFSNGSITLTGNVINQSSETQTFQSTPLVLGANVSFTTTAGGNFVINDTLALSNGNTVRSATFTGPGNTTINGAISNGTASSGNLILSGPGTLTLTGDNSAMTGTVSLNGGILNANASNALGSGGATNTLIFNGGTLQAGGNLVSPNTRGIELAGTGTIDTQSNDVTIDGIISGPGGLAKLGSGTLILTAANTFSGVIGLHEGVLNIQNAGALGSNIAGLAVAGGSALEIQGGITVANEPLALNGSGINQNGALRSVSGNNIWSGPISLGTAAEIQVEADSLTLSGNILLGANLLTTDTLSGLTISGVISGTGGLTKEGADSLILSGNNTFTGTTTVSDGQLEIGNGGTSGLLTGNLVNDASVQFNRADNSTYAGVISGSGGTTIMGGGTLSLTGNSTGFTGTTTISAGALQIGNGGTSGSLSGPIVNNSQLIFNRSSNLTQPGDISGTGSVTVQGTGVVTLTGTNSYSGATIITNGTLASGDLSNSHVTVSGGSFSPGGLNAISTITVESLTLTGGDLIFDLGNGTSDLIQIVGGTASLTQNTIFSFNNDNFAPGSFTLLTGMGVPAFDLTMLSIHSNIPGLVGDFSIVGNDLIFHASLTSGSTWDGGAGTPNWSDANNWDPDGVPATSSPLTFAGTVETNVNTNAPRTTGSITFDANAGAFTIGSDLITLGGDLTNNSNQIQTFLSPIQMTGSVTKTAATGGFTFEGDIALSTSNAIRTLTFDGTETITVNGVISNGPTASSGNLIKNGNGTLELLGLNTYTGTTTINGGTVVANSSSSFGDGSASNTLTLANATLQATGNITSPTTRGIVLAGPTTMDTNTHAISLAGIVSGPGALTKQGEGILTLSGANTFSGPITIQEGAINAQNNTALGTNLSTLTVQSGGALQLQNNISIGPKPITLNGTGVSNDGALRNISGNNALAGTITLGSNSLIQVDAGSLSLSGTTQLANFNLTTNLTGNMTISGLLTGAGNLTLNGPGNLTLTGTNTLTGTTTVASGILQLGNGGTTGTLAGPIINNSQIVLNHSGPVTMASAISGSGTVNKTGSNTLALTGTNTYTGATTISDGVLQIGNGGTTGSLTGPIINNSSLVFNRSNTLTYPGNISGSGTLTQSGSGTTRLTGSNTYTGYTFILGGELAPGNLVASTVGLQGGFLSPGGLGSFTQIQVNGLDLKGGQFAFDLGASGISDQILIGSGGVDLANQTNFFFNNNGFSSGTFTLLTGTDVSSLDLTMLSFTSNINGLTGDFSLHNDSLLFTGTNSGIFTGPLLENSPPVNTPVIATFLVAGNAQTGTPLDNNIIQGLIFNPSSSLRVFNNLTVTGGGFAVMGGSATLTGGNVITPGNFNKTGPGFLDVFSNVQVGGSANVMEGGMAVNGAFNVPGGLTVFQNALLGGSGVINGNVFNNGKVNPGNSPGTLTINGNFTQSSAGTLQIEAASLSNFDRLVVSGTAFLAGTLEFIPIDGFAVAYGQQFPILEAGSIVGGFDNIVVPAKFRGRFLNDGNTGILLLAPDTYTRVATNQNQWNVAKALDSFIPAVGNDREVVSTALDFLTAEQYPAAFDQIMPAFHESVANIGINLAQTQGQIMQQQLSMVRLAGRGFRAAGVPMEPLKYDKGGQVVSEPKNLKSEVSMETPLNTRWSAWAQGSGVFAKATSAMSLPNYRFESGGFLFGADYEWSESLVTGVFAGYEGAYARYGNGADTRMNGVRFGAYATYDPVDSGFYMDGIVWGGASNYKTRRKIQFSFIDRTASANQDTGELNALLGGGYDWQVGNFTFGPAASLQYTYFGIAPFTETGADSLNLRVGQQNANSLQSYIGGRVAYTARLTDSILLIPEVRIFWQHEFLNNPRTIQSALDSGNGPWFGYRTQNPSRDAVWAGVGATLQLGERLNTFFFYNADFGRQDYISHVISGGLGWSF